MTERLFFVAGLPRSGTTLLMNLLGQNPRHHVTPTSGLIHLVRHALRQWPMTKEFRAQGLDEARPFVLHGLRGLMLGFFSEPFANGQIVFDKSRGWLKLVDRVEEILERPIRIVTPVRDVRAIVASLENAQRKRSVTNATPWDESPAAVVARARTTLQPNRVTGRSIARLRLALNRYADRLALVPYVRLAEAPIETMEALHAALELDAFAYDADHVEQITHEDDTEYGMDLHTIRPRIEPPPVEPWQGVLPDDFCTELAETYADINALATGPFVDGARSA